MNSYEPSDQAVRHQVERKSTEREITVTILTACLDEVDNIDIWLSEIKKLYENGKLTHVKEIVIVDDGSTDGTLAKIESNISTFPLPINLIRRNKKMGTLDAQIVGARECKSEYVLVMDSDLQHPVSFIPSLLKEINGSVDIVVGSRYMKGGKNNWDAYRGLVSRVATFMAHVMIKNSRHVSDPLSGYFVIKRQLLAPLAPYASMYKPLLYAISMSKDTNIVEVPITMEERLNGESKIVTNPLKVILRYFREILVFWINSKKQE